MLESFGLSDHAERVYRALLREPAVGEPVLAERLGLRQPRVREVLAELVGAGLAEAQPAGHGCVALPPEQAVGRLIVREEQRLDARRMLLDRARAEVGSLAAEFVAGRRRAAGGLVEELTGAAAVLAGIDQVLSTAGRAIGVVLADEDWPAHTVELAGRLSAAATRPGVAVRLVVPEVSLAQPRVERCLDTAAEVGVQVRVHPAPPVRLLLADDDDGVVPSDPDAPWSGAYVLRGAGLVATLAALFDEVWRDATPYPRADEAAADPEEARLRQIVMLLARGHKDEAVARRLGVSVRTVGRLVSAAVERLQATSRFEAGVLAVERGWVRVARPPGAPAIEAAGIGAAPSSGIGHAGGAHAGGPAGAGAGAANSAGARPA
jgi:sugar-specific transcriptional regulator TrmB/DNA-binding CsgD family transcriptional regulator